MNISSKLRDAIIKEYLLTNKLSEIESRITLLNESIEESKSKYGWKDFYFNGFLGGNRPLVKSVHDMSNELAILLQQKKEIKPQLKRIKKSVNSDLIKIISPLNKTLENYLIEKERWLRLERKSKSYRNMVIKVEKGIRDALLFLSWQKLVNHPDAKSKLGEFKKETSEYQDIVFGLAEEILAIKGEVLVFDKFIKFSTQATAMDSFKMLATRSGEYYKLAYDKVEEYIKKSNILLAEVKSTVIQLNSTKP